MTITNRLISFLRPSRPSRGIGSYAGLPYLFFGSFIAAWWILALHPISSNSSEPLAITQPLMIKTSALLQELSPLERSTLQRALAGQVPLMIELIDQWDNDALLLAKSDLKGVQRLPTETYFQAHVLSSLIQNSSLTALHKLNCKMNLEWMHDDRGLQLHIEDHFLRFLPQTYIAASFLLAIAQPNKLVALPKGLRQLNQIYSPEILATIPENSDRLHSEKLSLMKPHLAFVAPYSHPPSLEMLLNQNIKLFSIHHVGTLGEIQEALLKVGHASNHILEAQLLAIFMEACFLSIDNRLLALGDQEKNPQIVQGSMLYLSHHQHYFIPTKKSLAGRLVERATTKYTHLRCLIPDQPDHWRIPFEQEQILQADPDLLVVSTPLKGSNNSIEPALHQTKAYQSQQIFYVDEAIQESPTQYIALAYFDLYQTLLPSL